MNLSDRQPDSPYRQFVIDLRNQPPRSPRVRLGPFIILARCLDKCHAHLAGMAGEYVFDSMLDRFLFDFKGITGDQFKAKVAAGGSDEEMLRWLWETGLPRTEAEILAWGADVLRYSLAYDPTGMLHATPERVAYLTAQCVKYGLDPLCTPVLERLELDDQRSFEKSAPGEQPSRSDYLSFQADLNSSEVVAACDELSLWSAAFGLMLLEQVPLGRNLKVLDIGCGAGFPALELAQRLGQTSTVVGLDPWEAALERARFKARVWGVKNVELVHGDAASMPFASAHFDIVVSNLGLNNFRDPEAAFAECRRVMKPSAKLALTTNLQGHMAEFYGVFESTLRSLDQTAAIDSLRQHIGHRATVEGIGALLARHGLRVTRVREATSVMRFSDGNALLRHYFIKLGFLDAWKAVVAPADRERVFSLLEAGLDDRAQSHGDLTLTIPMAYVEGEVDLDDRASMGAGMNLEP